MPRRQLLEPRRPDLPDADRSDPPDWIAVGFSSLLDNCAGVYDENWKCK